MAKESGFADRQAKRVVSSMISEETKQAVQGNEIEQEVPEKKVSNIESALTNIVVTNAKERKSKRVSFLMYPSLFEAFGKKCEELERQTGKRVSKNDVLNKLVASFCGSEE